MATSVRELRANFTAHARGLRTAIRQAIKDLRSMTQGTVQNTRGLNQTNQAARTMTRTFKTADGQTRTVTARINNMSKANTLASRSSITLANRTNEFGRVVNRTSGQVRSFGTMTAQQYQNIARQGSIVARSTRAMATESSRSFNQMNRTSTNYSRQFISAMRNNARSTEDMNRSMRSLGTQGVRQTNTLSNAIRTLRNPLNEANASTHAMARNFETMSSSSVQSVRRVGREVANTASQMPQQASIMTSAFNGVNSVLRNLGGGLTTFRNAVGTIAQPVMTATASISRSVIGGIVSPFREATNVVKGYATALGLLSTGALANTGMARLSAIENAGVSLEVMLGDAEKADAFLDDVLTFARTTPFAFPDLAESARNLVAFGMETDKVVPTMQAIGDAAAGAGKGSQGLNMIAAAFGDLQITANASLDPIRRLEGNGVPALKILANQAGISVDEMQKKISSGSIESTWAIESLVEGMQNGTDGVAGETAAMAGLMERMKDTWTGSVDSLKSSISSTMATIMEPMKPHIQAAMAWFGDTFSKLPNAITIFKDVAVTAFDYISNAISKLPLLSLSDGFSIIKNVFQAAIPIVQSFGSSMVEHFKNILPTLQSVLGGIKEVASFAMPYLKDAVNAVVPFVLTMFNKIYGFWQKEGQSISNAVSNAFNTILSIVNFVMPAVLFVVDMIWTAIKNVINGAVNVIQGIIGIFVGIFTGDLSKMWEGIKNLFIGAIELIWGIINLTFFGRIAKGVIMFFTLLRSLVRQGWEFVVKLFTKGVQPAWKVLKRAWDYIVDITQFTFRNIKNFISDFWVGLTKIFGAVKEISLPVIKAFTTMWKSVGNIFTNLRKVISDGWNFITGIFSSVLIRIGELISAGFNAYIRTVNSVLGSIRNGITYVWNGIYNFFSKVLTSIGQFIARTWTGARDNTMGTVNAIASFIRRIWNFMFTTIRNFAGRIFNAVKSAFTRTYNTTKSVFNTVKDFITTVWNAYVNIIRTVATTIFNAVRTAFTNVWNTTRNIFNTVRNFISNLWTNLFNIIRTSANNIFNAVRSAFNFVLNTTRSIFNSVWNFIKRVWNSIYTTIRTFVQNTVNRIRQHWEMARNNTMGIFNAVLAFIRRVWTSIFNAIRDRVLSIFNRIRDTFNSARETISSIFNNVWTFIRSIWTRIYENIASRVTRIRDNIRNGFDTARKWVSDIVSNMWTNVRNTFDDIVSAARDLPGRIGTGIKNMANKVKEGISSVSNRMLEGLAVGVNGVIRGVNWVLDKIGVSTRLPEWKPNYASASGGGNRGRQLNNSEIPQYAKGTGGHPGGLAMVGDGGMEELIQFPNGRLAMSPNTNTLVNMPRGTAVMSGPDTKSFLSSLPHYNNGVGKFVSGAIDWTKDMGGRAVGAVKNGVGALKDKAMDVWDWMAGGAKNLMNKVLDTMGVVAPSFPGGMGEMSKGAFGYAKNKVIDYVKGLLPDFSAGGGGNGPGWPSPFRKSSSFNPARRHPITGRIQPHNGDDWAAPSGTPIPSQSAGRVTKSGWGTGYGNVIYVQSGGGLEYRYAHNSRNLVSVGDIVRPGQTIGLVGSTGDSTGPHVHYEVRRNGRPLNPSGFADGGIVDMAQLAWIAEGGWAESVISHDPAKRVRQKAIWKETGDNLGFTDNDSKVVSLLQQLNQLVGQGFEGMPDELVLNVDSRPMARTLLKPLNQMQADMAANKIIMKGGGRR
ncbi:peptidoglycan DD-metalloendopeptidase family protein [Shouchella miscanthi]|uniref:peptidoglycan DD-metalloendopeptidase family protein n=1 Tax=Shouchella miscanthi TaxID=2598861 RepID=UPI0011A87721|nr:peptidoglycan DD-metalloendopeptidase family protein [Shouchella miscanthi]